KTVPAAPVTLGTHTWTALDATAPYEYDLELQGTPGTCVDYTNTAMIQQTQQQASEKVTVCAPTGTVDKTVSSVAANTDGTWTVVYDVVVSNPSTTGLAFDYQLRD